MDNSNLSSTPDFQGMMFGQNGCRHLSGIESGESTEVYKKITALSAVVVTLTQDKGEVTLTSLPIPAGTSIYGRFKTITMVSGDILAYIG